MSRDRVCPKAAAPLSWGRPRPQPRTPTRRSFWPGLSATNATRAAQPAPSPCASLLTAEVRLNSAKCSQAAEAVAWTTPPCPKSQMHRPFPDRPRTPYGGLATSSSGLISDLPAQPDAPIRRVLRVRTMPEQADAPKTLRIPRNSSCRRRGVKTARGNCACFAPSPYHQRRTGHEGRDAFRPRCEGAKPKCSL